MTISCMSTSPISLPSPVSSEFSSRHCYRVARQSSVTRSREGDILAARKADLRTRTLGFQKTLVTGLPRSAAIDGVLK